MSFEKTKVINLRLSVMELQAIRERMESVGIRNMSAYMLKMAMNGFIIQLDMSDMKEVLRLMKINSNNLNQYAKRQMRPGAFTRKTLWIWWECIRICCKCWEKCWSD